MNPVFHQARNGLWVIVFCCGLSMTFTAWAAQTVNITIKDAAGTATDAFLLGETGTFGWQTLCDSSAVTLTNPSATWSATPTGSGVSGTIAATSTNFTLNVEGDYTAQVAVTGTLPGGQSFSATGSKAFKVLKLELDELTLMGAFPVVRDGAAGLPDNGMQVNYGTPDWKKGRTPEESFPVAYKRNVHPEVTSKHKVTPNTYSGTLKIRGKSSFNVGSTLFNFTFAQKPVTFSGGSGTYPQTFTQNIASGELPDTVQTINFPTTWEVSRTGNANTWKNVANQSSNTMYVLLHNPTAPTFFRTLFHIGCSRAQGIGGANPNSAAVTAIWGEFTGRVVKRWNGTPATGMTYQANPNLPCFSTADLLKFGDGKCEAWASFLQDTIKAQGISGTQIITLVHKPLQNYVPEVFWIKNWDFTGIPNLEEISPNIGPVDLLGIPAQGALNNDPQAIFRNHAILLYQSKFYDPSYGTGAFSSILNWQRMSLDAISYRKGTAPGSLRIFNINTGSNWPLAVHPSN